MRLAISAALCFVPLAAQAQVITGAAKALDGDTIEMAGERIRLHGIDAVEGSQTCNRDGQIWQCGKDARDLLASLVDGQSVTCRQRDVDAYRRIVATCEVNRRDLAEAMIYNGLALALAQFSHAYVDSETRMRANRIGIWASQFDAPADYRAAHPDQFKARAQSFSSPRQLADRPARPSVPASDVYFANCNAARAAGAAPMYYGQPGYRPEMDGDRDGIACEPYRGRR